MDWRSSLDWMNKWQYPLLDAQTRFITADIEGNRQEALLWKQRASWALGELQRHTLLIMLGLNDEAPDPRTSVIPAERSAQLLRYLHSGKGGLQWKKISYAEMERVQNEVRRGVLAL